MAKCYRCQYKYCVRCGASGKYHDRGLLIDCDEGSVFTDNNTPLIVVIISTVLCAVLAPFVILIGPIVLAFLLLCGVIGDPVDGYDLMNRLESIAYQLSIPGLS